MWRCRIHHSHSWPYTQPSSPAKAGDPVIVGAHMARERNYWVYIVASGIGGTLYIGVTNDLIRRVYEHKTKAAESFTKKYNVDRLIYFEQFDDIENAIRREKRLKKWNRAWKIRLIEETNPNWSDLYPSIARP
jgi:putative endonuclease